MTKNKQLEMLKKYRDDVDYGILRNKLAIRALNREKLGMKNEKQIQEIAMQIKGAELTIKRQEILLGVIKNEMKENE